MTWSRSVQRGWCNSALRSQRDHVRQFTRGAGHTRYALLEKRWPEVQTVWSTRYPTCQRSPETEYARHKDHMRCRLQIDYNRSQKKWLVWDEDRTSYDLYAETCKGRRSLELRPIRGVLYKKAILQSIRWFVTLTIPMRQENNCQHSVSIYI